MMSEIKILKRNEIYRNSLNLSLTMGINIKLFWLVLSNYAKLFSGCLSVEVLNFKDIQIV